MTGEFDLIERIRQRAGSAPGVLVGIGDDAAVVAPAAGQALIITTDTLVEGRHFLADWPPEDIGHLALAVNLSDLAAMAANPRWGLLSLTLPRADADWLDRFLDGFLPLAHGHGLTLIGGNLSSGPLSITVQVLGESRPDSVVLRHSANAGDLVAITGVPGEAAAALTLGAGAPDSLQQRLRRPSPRVAAALALQPWITSMADISDGLLADLGHLLRPDQGADILLAKLPVSDALRQAVSDTQERWALQLNGGSDYELLLTVPPAAFESALSACHSAGVELTVIGQVNVSGHVRCLDANGLAQPFNPRGWDHFVTSD